MKKLEKKLETLLEKMQPHTEKSPEIEVLNKISHHLETLEEMAHQHIDDKDFLRALKKLKSGPLLEELKSAYDPAFVVGDFTDIKEKILAWLVKREKGEGATTLGDIFQAYLEKIVQSQKDFCRVEGESFPPEEEEDAARVADGKTCNSPSWN